MESLSPKELDEFLHTHLESIDKWSHQLDRRVRFASSWTLDDELANFHLLVEALMTGNVPSFLSGWTGSRDFAERFVASAFVVLERDIATGPVMPDGRIVPQRIYGVTDETRRIWDYLRVTSVLPDFVRDITVARISGASRVLTKAHEKLILEAAASCPMIQGARLGSLYFEMERMPYVKRVHVDYIHGEGCFDLYVELSNTTI